MFGLISLIESSTTCRGVATCTILLPQFLVVSYVCGLLAWDQMRYLCNSQHGLMLSRVYRAEEYEKVGRCAYLG